MIPSVVLLQSKISNFHSKKAPINNFWRIRTEYWWNSSEMLMLVLKNVTKIIYALPKILDFLTLDPRNVITQYLLPLVLFFIAVTGYTELSYKFLWWYLFLFVVYVRWKDGYGKLNHIFRKLRCKGWFTVTFSGIFCY